MGYLSFCPHRFLEAFQIRVRLAQVWLEQLTRESWEKIEGLEGKEVEMKTLIFDVKFEISVRHSKWM